MNKIKSIIYVLLIVGLFGINNIIVSANEKGIPYINPKWEEYMELSDEEKKEYNIAPEKYIVDYVDTTGNVTPFNTYGNMTSALPSYFNLRDSYATDIYDQGSAGLCWAYTTATTIESHLKRTKGVETNISVKQMDYATYYSGQVNSSYYGKFKNPYASRYLSGNTYYIRSLADGWFSDSSYYPYLATGVSAMTESDFGIYNDNPTYNSSVTSTTIYNDENIEYQVTEYVDFPNYDKSTAMINLIKSQIYNYGALYVDSIAPDYRSGSCYDTENEMIIEQSTCTDATIEGRHAMAIIGWDDSYGGTGAFILQNSWGEDSYATFPHMSYQSIINHAHGIKTMVEKTWDNNYDFSTEPILYIVDSSGNRTLYSNTYINYDETVNKRIDIIFDKSVTSAEKLHSINFESDVQNGQFDVYISNTGKVADLVKYDTVTSELPGLITVDFASRDISLENGYFMVSIVPKTTGSYFSPLINAFTIDTETSTTPSVVPQGDLKYYEPYDVYYNSGYGVYDFETYTNNIPDGNKLTYKIYNSSNSLVTQSTSTMIIYTREIFNNSQSSRLLINNSTTNGIYRVDVVYNNTVLDSFNINFYSDKVGSGTETSPYIITTPEQLNHIRTGLSLYYKLGSNIDMNASTSEAEGEYYNSGLGWDPIDSFTGQLNGGGYTIKGLYINRPTENYIGLFSSSNASYVHNITLESFNITGNNYVGTLYGKLGNANSSGLAITDITINNAIINGTNYVGGIIGYNQYTSLDGVTIKKSTLESDSYLGGIIGQNTSATMANLKADNNTYNTSSGTIGGVIGITASSITNSYVVNSTFTGTTGSVIGGIVGSTSSTVTDSYSISEITGTTTGGIIGKNTAAATYERLYHIGAIEGVTNGGIVGNAYSGSIINDVYKIGNLNENTVAAQDVGGIVGKSSTITINNAYYVGDVSYVPDTTYDEYSAGGIIGTADTINLNNTYYSGNALESVSYGEDYVSSTINATNYGKKTRDELKEQTTFTNFDFDTVWEFKNTNVYPTLKSNEYIFMSDIVTEEEIDITLNSTYNILYTITPSNPTIDDIEFISNNEDVVTVDNEGVVTAISEGTTTITINSLDKSISKDITVNVVNKKIEIADDYIITPETIYDNSEATIDFNIELIGINSSDVSYKVINADTEIETNLVTISKISESTEGVTTIIKLKATIPSGMPVGNYKINAIASSFTSNELTFKVNDYINVTSVSLNKTSITLNKGETETLIATINPNNAMNKNVTWSSNNTNVATVEDGVVNAVGKGTATITVTTVDGNKTSEAIITVLEPSITIGTITYTNSINSETKLYKDYTGTIVNNVASQDIANNTTLTVTIKNSSNTDITNKFTISGNTINNNSATITINVPNTLGNGTYTVEIKTNNTSKSYQFLIHNPIYVTGIDADDIEIESGTTTIIVPTITPDNAFNKNVTYKSNNTNIATVDANGLVTGISGGTTEIVITAADNNKFSKTINVKVNGDSIVLEEESNYQITDDENDNNIGYIDNIKLNSSNNNINKLSASMFIDEFSIFNAKIKDSYGELIDSSNYDNVYLGTGSQVIVGDKIYNIIVSGDIDGDADITISDAYSSLLHIVERKTLSGNYFKAAEIDGDGEITTADVYRILLFIVGRRENV